MIRTTWGRITDYGKTVTDPQLFGVERYPTVWPMTSTIEARTTATLSAEEWEACLEDSGRRLRLAVARRPVSPLDVFLFHKTTTATSTIVRPLTGSTMSYCGTCVARSPKSLPATSSSRPI